MLYIHNPSLDPYYNLALEEYVLKYLEAPKAYLILWQNEPSVIIGRFQNTLAEINYDFVQKNKINVVRRITGGGAVYHDLGNLNFSLIVQTERQQIDFQRFTQPVLQALAQMGIQAQYSGRNDLVIDGHKFSGNAQYHYQNKVLHHGTILFNSNLEHIQKALKGKARQVQLRGVPSIPSRVTNIANYLPVNIRMPEFKDLLLFHLSRGQQIKDFKLDSKAQEKIEGLRAEKYLTWDWNFGYSPAFNLHKNFKYGGGKIDFFLNIEKEIVRNCAIYGDFFSNYDPQILEEKFQGLRYCPDDFEQLFNNQLWAKIFGPIHKQELMEVFFK